VIGTLKVCAYGANGAEVKKVGFLHAVADSVVRLANLRGSPILLDHDFRREHLERSSNPPERPTDSRPTSFLLVYGKAFATA
jgi:hypothetical protein